jgi:hypothetical protein
VSSYIARNASSNSARQARATKLSSTSKISEYYIRFHTFRISTIITIFNWKKQQKNALSVNKNLSRLNEKYFKRAIALAISFA